jgi:CBS-domain-containing membrane protein
MKDKNKVLTILFILQILFFILILLTILFFIETIHPLYSFIPFLISGIILTILTMKWVKEKKLRIWLMINGLSATALILFAVLHNLFYALNTVVDNRILSTVFSILEGGTFLISIPLSPILFLVSTVVVIVIYLRKKDNDTPK